jgi:Tfp pilus assembly protein PilV
MQIPKSLLIICMAALGVSSLHAQRTDSDVQAKAREQLRQKLSESQSQPASTPTAPAPAAKAVVETPAQPAAPEPAVEVKPVTAAAPEPVVEVKPVAVAAPVAVTPVTDSGEPVPVYSALDAQQDSKAREALRQKLQELKAQDKASTPAIVIEPAEPKVAAKPKATKPKATKPEVTAETKNPKAVQVVSSEPKKTKVSNTVNNDPAFGTPEVVPAPAPNSKDAKLADLLQQYKSNKISPTEYHLERAKILAEP